jgi:hypothetical protein
MRAKKCLDLFCCAVDFVTYFISVEADANIDPSISAREASAQPCHLAVIRGKNALNEGKRDIIAFWRE